MTDEIITQLGYLNEEKQKITLEIGKLKKQYAVMKFFLL